MSSKKFKKNKNNNARKNRQLNREGLGALQKCRFFVYLIFVFDILMMFYAPIAHLFGANSVCHHADDWCAGHCRFHAYREVYDHRGNFPQRPGEGLCQHVCQPCKVLRIIAVLYDYPGNYQPCKIRQRNCQYAAQRGWCYAGGAGSAEYHHSSEKLYLEK